MIWCIRKMKKEAGLHAVALLQAGCQRVLIVWDRMPKWGGDGKCETDRIDITKSLQAAQVNMELVQLFCIDEEMESWLYADGRWVQQYYQSKTTHKLNAFGDNDTREKQRSPKNRLKSWLRGNKMREPDEFNDPPKIVRLITDFSRAASWNPTFGEYVNAIKGLC